MSANKAKPFVKWAGGKTQLLTEIDKYLSVACSSRRSITYVESFVGGGAVLFWALQKYPNIERAIINDINPHLISVYKAVKYAPSELLKLLEGFQKEYALRDEVERKNYYLLQRDRYNNSSMFSDVERAACFIFLNKTCFNGLYRVNSKGVFNVPHGRYNTPMICDYDTILADSCILQNVEILCGDFDNTIDFASSDTLYYLDPPYKPITKTSSFCAYTSMGFDDSEQMRLRHFCGSLVEHRAQFILSNSDVTGDSMNEGFFDNLYMDYNIRRVEAMRMINSKASKRGKLSELLISNIQ